MSSSFPPVQKSFVFNYLDEIIDNYVDGIMGMNFVFVAFIDV